MVPSAYIKLVLSPHMLYPVSNGRDGKTDLKKVHKCRTESTKIVLRKDLLEGHHLDHVSSPIVQ